MNYWKTDNFIRRLHRLSKRYGIEKALDWLENRQEKIELQLFKNQYSEKVPSLFLYDVTSSYFEGEQNELAAYGYNRDW
ncbi:MAG: transposase IS4 family protein [uncultured bacterium]|nr:MAG: transposase IS4 family protein [uncultured bacterium]